MFKHFLFNTKTAGMDLSRSILFKPSSFNYMTLTNRAMMLNRSLMPQYHPINKQAMMMFMGVQPRFTFIAKAPQGLSEYQSDKKELLPFTTQFLWNNIGARTTYKIVGRGPGSGLG